MTPTNELRFVQRDLEPRRGNPKYVRILQQKWARDALTAARLDLEPCEWRDVPVVKETDRG